LEAQIANVKARLPQMPQAEEIVQGFEGLIVEAKDFFVQGWCSAGMCLPAVLFGGSEAGRRRARRGSMLGSPQHMAACRCV
jgi:hypothetical protein